MGAVSDFMNENAGNNIPGFTFTNIGDSVMGTVMRRSVPDVPVIGSKTGETEKKLILELKTDKEYTQTKKDRKTGEPMLVTGDEWSLWIGKGQMLTALGQALKEENAPEDAPCVGDRIKVTFKETEPSKTPGFNPKKVYEVQYKAGAPVAATSVDELL